MSQVEESHTHHWPDPKNPVPIPVPGAIRHCDDQECAVDRDIITALSKHSRAHLVTRVAVSRDRVKHELVQLQWIEEALKLQEEGDVS